MSRSSQRRAANSANRRIAAASVLRYSGATLPAVETITCACGERIGAGSIQARIGYCPTCRAGLLTCEACGQRAFTLVEGRCFECGRS